MVLISLLLKISSRPRISVIKNGKDDLSVKSLDLIMNNPTNEKEKTTYSCRGFTITGDCSLKPNKQCVKSLGQCLSQILPPPARPTKNPNPRPNPRVTTRPPKAPAKDQTIDKMIVNMGADGTRDDVKLKICSDGNAVCCTSDKLSNLLSREWVENKQETWASGKFGKCKKSVFKVMLLKVKPTCKIIILQMRTLHKNVSLFQTRRYHPIQGYS